MGLGFGWGLNGEAEKRLCGCGQAIYHGFLDNCGRTPHFGPGTVGHSSNFRPENEGLNGKADPENSGNHLASTG